MIELLNKVPLFSKLNHQQLEAISTICTKKTFKPGTVLFNEKEPGSIFYILSSGSIKIYTATSSGEEMILSLMKAGDSFGELSLIDGKPRSASAQTLEESVLISITAPSFIGLMKTHFGISLGIMQEMCSRLRDTNQHVQDRTFLDARTRVIKSLVTLANKNGTRTGNSITIKMTLNYDEVSQMAGVQKPILMQVIRDLQDKRLLSLNGQEMRLDLGQLRE
ncbi:cAMP receptor protein [Paenibacillus konkukensis]|uniref:cAMP receptor protein n=1 Tax=Paenibacillus konkukensis TaxID=2020716 RepID=A0ABY4RYB0_9BACL|nr:Crp/Fnr family transcriptional regulator [Paenibacillus konkukensis]UQZ86734.1 cAMP receptor protein [Paenibacillus konkukensis]